MVTRVMITIIDKRAETAWISDFSDPEPKKIEKNKKKDQNCYRQRTEAENWIQSLTVTVTGSCFL